MQESSPQTPQALSDQSVQPRSVGQPSKRVTRDHSINSPHSKKSSRSLTLDDCLDDLSDIIKDARGDKARQATDAEEIAQVNQILKQDGYSESDVVFAQALNLCSSRIRCRAFLDLETKEGRLNWVNVSWDFVSSKSK